MYITGVYDCMCSAARVYDFVLSLRIFVPEFANYNVYYISCVRIFIQCGSIEFNTLTKIFQFFLQILRILLQNELSALVRQFRGLAICCPIP